MSMLAQNLNLIQKETI